MTLTVRLNPDIEKRLTQLAKLTGRTKSYYARALIEANIEDIEDMYLAEMALADPRPSISHEQVRKELGLEN